MILSERAAAYLRKQKRITKYYTDSNLTSKYFARQNIKINEILVAIQANFSGYKLTINNKPNHTFLLSLFSKEAIEANKKIELYSFKNGYLLDFGEHETAPFNFYITDLGEICTLGVNDGDKPNIVCSSVEKFIEQYALRNELTTQKEDAYYYSIIDIEKLNNVFAANFIKINACSDKYTEWHSNDHLIIEKGTCLDKPEFYLHVYSETENINTSFINHLKNENILY